MGSLRERYTWRGRVQALAASIELHSFIGMCMVVFAVGVLVNPSFPFQGMLLTIHRGLVDAYALLFAVCGVSMVLRRPNGVGWILWTSPVLFHTTLNIVDIVLNDFDVLLPVVALYAMLNTLLLKLTLLEAVQD